MNSRFLFILLFLCAPVFPQIERPNSKLTITALSGRFVVSGVVDSEFTKTQVISIFRNDISPDVDATSIKVDPSVQSFGYLWQKDFKALLRDRQLWHENNGRLVFENDDREITKRVEEQIAGYSFTPTSEDQIVQLISFGKKALLINLFATWCGPCRTQIADLNTLFRDFHSEGLEIVALDTDDETPENINQFVQVMKIPYKTGIATIDLQAGFVKLTKFSGIPQTFLIVDGNITGIFTSASPTTMSKMRTAVESILRPAQK